MGVTEVREHGTLVPGPTLPVERGRLRLEFIDALRGLAILMVLTVHTSQTVSPGVDVLNKLAAGGAWGVQLFFVMSAYTLFLSWENRKKRERRPTVNFFLRRFFRIAPAFYLAILFYLWWNGVGPQFWAPNGIDGWQVATTFAFVHGWHPESITSVVPGGWSIAVEWGAYLLMPLFFAYCRTLDRALATTLVTAALGVVCFRLVRGPLLAMYPAEQEYLVFNFGFFWLPAQLTVFCAGFALYFVIRDTGPMAEAARKRRGIVCVAVALYLLGSLMSGTSFVWVPGQAVFAFAFALLAYGLYLHPARFLVNPVMRYLGKVSYSVYLAHFALIPPVWWAISRLPVEGVPAPLLFAVTLVAVTAVAAAVATVLYRLVEVPGQELGRRTIAYLERREAPLPDPGHPGPAIG